MTSITILCTFGKQNRSDTRDSYPWCVDEDRQLFVDQFNILLKAKNVDCFSNCSAPPISILVSISDIERREGVTHRLPNGTPERTLELQRPQWMCEYDARSSTTSTQPCCSSWQAREVSAQRLYAKDGDGSATPSDIPLRAGFEDGTARLTMTDHRQRERWASACDIIEQQWMRRSLRGNALARGRRHLEVNIIAQETANITVLLSVTKSGRLGLMMSNGASW